MIFNRFTHPSSIIDLLADVWVEEIIKVVVRVFIIKVCSDPVIDILSGVLVDVTMIDLVSDIGVEVLSDVNANAVVAAMTAS